MSIEARIKEIATKIDSLRGTDAPGVFDQKHWTGLMLRKVMDNEHFKAPLFRFTDVLPSIKDDKLVVRLLKEYFSEEAEDTLLLKHGIKNLPEGSLVSHVAASAVRSNVEAMARQFITGTSPEDALPNLISMRDDGIAFSVDLLGEVVLSDHEANYYIDRYLRLLYFLAPVTADWEENTLLDTASGESLPRLNISLKISSFYSQLDPINWEGSIIETAKALRLVIEKAKALGAAVIFDMEHYYLKDLTLAIFKQVATEFPDYEHLGIVIQTYLKDSEEDLLSLSNWAWDNKRKINVRLVKGAYWDYEQVVNTQKGWPVPVFMNKAETDLNYEKLTHLLLQNADALRPQIATHNIRSISNAIAIAEELGLDKDKLEIQMLYGMAEPIRDALKEMGYRVRLYCPVGELIPGMSYMIRRLLENSSNEAFLRKSYYDNIPLAELVKKPAPPQDMKKLKEKKPSGFLNEPLTDFSKKTIRKDFKNALLKVKKEFNNKYPLYYEGHEQWSDEEIISTNPSNPKEIIGKVAKAGRDEAQKALAYAKAHQVSWRDTPAIERADCLLRTADELRKHRFELSALTVYECGKSWAESDADIAEACDFLTYYSKEMRRLSKPAQMGNYPGELNTYHYEPRGVGVVISPWNFPVAIACGMLSAAIVTGNSVIFKPSSLTPVLGWKLLEAFRASGVPKSVLQFLPGPGEEVGEYLAAHLDIDFIAFTGSKEVGLNLVRIAGDTKPGQQNVKKVVAEMGGKNAIIVDETADLDEAVRGVLHSALGFQGQKCSACSRVIVSELLADEFTTRLKLAFASIKIGPTENPANFMGPLVDGGAYEKVSGFIDDGKKRDATVTVRDASEIPADGHFISPALFTSLKANDPLAGNEIFGPVLLVLRARDIEDAINIANQSEYALTGGIFSRSPRNIELARKKFRAGNLYINRGITGALVGRQPFGGFGMSGVGSKAGGPDYLLQFMNPVSISENTMRKGFTPLD
jgi:RHH-type proline utilization regulon transcriptional repressor/proline dehydrogenase/delta 1-pyrroline-5-carboxylate dehydrogenase